MIREALLHLPGTEYAYGINDTTIVLRLRTAKNDCTCCTVYYGDRMCNINDFSLKSQAMKKVASDELFDYYESVLDNCVPRVCYYFMLESKGQKLYYISDEFFSVALDDRGRFYQFAFNRREDMVTIPQWAQEAIIYQIFPDSFATGRKQMNYPDKRPQQGYGGTLKGITENLDYIKLVGANCLYLNPIFKAGAYHRYDTIDYYKIDEHLGTKEDFIELVSECHKKGIRVILDGVFNHTGIDFEAFKDVREKGIDSEYKDWYYDVEFSDKQVAPVKYATFGYYGGMPKLNTGNPEVEKYFLDVATYWIKEADIDGWRLDVANEVNHGFWRKFREEVKRIKPDAFLIGEIWEDSREWLRGDQFDSTMNYRFIYLTGDFFLNRYVNADTFAEHIDKMLMRYADPVSKVQMNLLDSHDVSRFLSSCNGNENVFRLSMAFLLTFVGTPSIFYGDEILMSGVTEDEYRKPMIWNLNNLQESMREYISSLCKIRTENPAFTDGSFKCHKTGYDDLFMFERKLGNDIFLVTFNRSDRDIEFKLPDEYKQYGYREILDVNNGNVFKKESVSIINIKV